MHLQSLFLLAVDMAVICYQELSIVHLLLAAVHSVPPSNTGNMNLVFIVSIPVYTGLSSMVL